MERVELVLHEPVKGPQGPSGDAINRITAFEKDGVWVGRSRVGANLDSGWHRHGEHDSYLLVTAGRGRIESASGGKGRIEVGLGDVVRIPGGAIHRELTGTGDLEAFVVRVGRGGRVFPVAGPDP